MELTVSSGLSFVETWLSGRKQQFAKLPWGSSPPCVQIAPFPPTSKFDGSSRRYHPGTRPPLSGGATSCSSVGSSTALLMLGSRDHTPPRRPYMGVWRNWRDAADSKSATMDTLIVRIDLRPPTCCFRNNHVAGFHAAHPIRRERNASDSSGP